MFAACWTISASPPLANLAVPTADHREAGAGVLAGAGDGQCNRGGAAFAVLIEIFVNARVRAGRVDDNAVGMGFLCVHCTLSSLLTFELPGT